MTSFTDIPISDIKEFLIYNKKPIGDHPHLDAWKLIEKDKTLKVPVSISDFFLAQNLSKIDIPSYKISQVLTSDVRDLIFITSLQNLPKDRILRILKYLNKLENDINIFAMLPKEISESIISKLDIKSVELICEISCDFSTFCNLHLRPILQQNLKCKTKIDIDKFSLKQLLYFGKNLKLEEEMTIKPNGYYHSLVLQNNKIYDGEIVIHEKYLNNIIQLASGADHAMILTAEGEVFAFGKNDFGQLGLGHNIQCDVPQLISDVNDVIYISVSDKHSMLLTANGNVYTTNNNKFTKLDLENIEQISAGFTHSLALGTNKTDKTNKNIYLITRNCTELLMNNSDVVSISTGYDHSLMLSNKGLIYAYGNNDYGQLGPNNEKIKIPTIITGLDEIIHIVAGDKYSLVLTTNDEVFKFGLEGDHAIFSPIKVEIT